MNNLKPISVFDIVTKNFAIATLFLCLQVNAQKTLPITSITIDPSTNLPDRYAPFDEYFSLNIPIDSMFSYSDILTIQIYKIDQTTTTWSLDIPSGGFTPPIYNLTHTIDKFHKTGKKFNTLTLIIPPIPPNTPIAVLIQYNNSDDIVNDLIDLNNDIFLNSGANAINLFSNIQNRVNRINSQYSRHVFSPPTFTLSEYQAQLITNGYAAHYTTITNALNACGTLEPHYNNLFSQLDNSSFCAQVFKCNCENEFVFKEQDNNFEKILLNLCIWKNANSIAREGLARGAYSFSDGPGITINPPSTLPILSASNFKKTILNLKESQVTLKKLKNYLLYNSNSTNVLNRNAILAEIEFLLVAIEAQLTVIDQEIDFFRLNLNHFIITTAVTTAPLNSIFQFAAMGNDVPSIKSAFGNHLIPDIGFISMLSFADETPKVIYRPYWGLNISLRAVNKNIKIKDLSYTGAIGINNSWQKFLIRTSISVGFTAMALDNALNNGEDFVKNTSFINGINYRINRFLRFGGGYVLYKKQNINPTLKPGLTTMPYLSLSVDLDIADWISKLTGKIF